MNSFGYLQAAQPPSYEECLRREHPIVDFGGPWYCRRCHERTDAGFAAWSRAQLERVRQQLAQQPEPA